MLNTTFCFSFVIEDAQRRRSISVNHADEFLGFTGLTSRILVDLDRGAIFGLPVKYFWA